MSCPVSTSGVLYEATGVYTILGAYEVEDLAVLLSALPVSIRTFLHLRAETFICTRAPPSVLGPHEPIL